MPRQKIMRKEWFQILAPRIFNNAYLGETHVFESRQMMGKGLTANLMNLTNDSKRQNININFEVIDVQNDKGITNIVGYFMVPSSVKRLIRRNIERIDMSFSCKTSDNKDLRVKPLMITRSATTGSVVAKIRKTARDFLVKHIANSTYDGLISNLVNHNIQSTLRKDLSKIYPLRICEIRSMELIDLEKKKEAKNQALVQGSKGTKEKVKETGHVKDKIKEKLSGKEPSKEEKKVDDNSEKPKEIKEDAPSGNVSLQLTN
jgi:ribosomal protein S3AE